MRLKVTYQQSLNLSLLMKNIILLILALSSLLLSQDKQTLKSRIDSLLNDDYFKATEISIEAYDLTINDTLYQLHNNLLMHPASNMKILTTSAGLLFLGPKYNFTTSLYYTGFIADSNLYGDLFAVGGLDPDFTTKDLDSMVVLFKNLGIKEILGNIYGDVSMCDSLFWGNGWMWDDDPSTDAPYMTALNINTNAIQVKVNYINKVPEVTLTPDTKYVDVKFTSFAGDTDNSKPVIIDRDWINRKNTILIKRDTTIDLPDDYETANEVNLWRPEFYFLTLLKESLLSHGIKFNGIKQIKTLPLNSTKACSHQREYDSVIVNLNKVSYNLGAEMTLRAMGEKYFGKPASAKKGLKLVDSLLTLSGLDPKIYRIVDGSGVSHYNLVTAHLLLSVLKYMYYKHRDLYNILYNSFPIGGADGTLDDRMIDTNAQNNVHAKTGSLSGVSTLSGYLTAKNGHEIVFSIMVAEFRRQSKTSKRLPG